LAPRINRSKSLVRGKRKKREHHINSGHALGDWNAKQPTPPEDSHAIHINKIAAFNVIPKLRVIPRSYDLGDVNDHVLQSIPLDDGSSNEVNSFG
jgi:hypothetical protein